MNAHLEMLDDELADTLEDARRRRGLKPKREPFAELVAQLTSSLIAASPRPPALGICQFCGARAPGRTVCALHEDLVDIDAGTSGVVTQPTFGGAR